MVGGKSWQPSLVICKRQGQTSRSGDVLRIYWDFLVSWNLQGCLVMVFHARPVLAHDKELGRGSHFRMWENPFGAGERPARNFLAVCLALGAVSAHPVAGRHWQALTSSQNLEPKDVVLHEGSPPTFWLRDLGRVSNLRTSVSYSVKFLVL